MPNHLVEYIFLIYY